MCSGCFVVPLLAFRNSRRKTREARFYWESKFNLYNAANVAIPVAVSVFPGENYQAPRSWAERAYHKLIYFNEVEKGGHFAAWEQPALFSAEFRAAFRSLRRQREHETTPPTRYRTSLRDGRAVVMAKTGLDVIR